MLTAIFYAITMVISMYMAHQASKTKNQSKKPNIDIEDGDFPVATEDKNYQLVYGTVEIKDSNCTWVGDLNAFPIEEKVKQKGLFGSKSKRVTVALGYRAGFKLALGYGELNLRGLSFDGKSFYTTKDNGNKNINISFTKNSGSSSKIDTASRYRNFFGDYKKEGGIEGEIYFHSGEKDSDYIPSYLLNKVGSDYAYANKGQSYLMFRNFYYGNSKQLKPVSVAVSRIPKIAFLDDKYAEIKGKSCNPINIICDLLLSFENGAGIDQSELDVASFIYAQKKLYDNDFGLSFVVSSDAIISDVIMEVMERIDAVFRIDNRTGKTSIKLIEKPKNNEDLMVIDDSVILKGGYRSVVRNAPNTLINEMKLTYTDVEDGFQKKVVVFSNEANYRETREVTSKSISMESVVDLNLAKRLLIREIKPLTIAHMKCELIVNRSCRFLQPGDMVILNSSKYKINNLRMRVLSVNIGNAAKSGVTLNLIEDLYGEMDYALSVTNSRPQDVQGELSTFDFKVIDAPYILSELEDSILSDGIQDQIILADKPNTTTVAYFIIDDKGQIIEEYAPFTSSVKVKKTTSRDSGVIEYIGNFNTGDIVEDSLAVIINQDGRQEIVNIGGIDYINNELLSVDRGCVDTLPLKLEAGDTIYLLNSGYGSIVEENHIVDNYISYKLLPTGISYTMDSDAVESFNYKIERRADLPLPVAKVMVNGSTIVEGDVITSNNNMTLNFTYKGKSRVDPTPYFRSGGSINAVDGVKSILTIRRSDGTVLHKEEITNGNYTYDFEELTGTFDVSIVNKDSKGRESINNPSFKFTKTE